MKRGTRTPDAEKERKRKQRRLKRYMELREELQLAGVIPVEPGGTKHGEQVDPELQGTQHLPQLTGEAARRGWAVPEDKKPGLVDELTAIVDDPEESNKVKVAAFNALRQADQNQWERDNQKDGKDVVTTAINISVVTVETSQQAIDVEVVSGDDGE